MTEIPFLHHLEPPFSISWTGAWAAGVTITISWTGATVDAPCGPYTFAVDGNTDGGDNLNEVQLSSAGAGSVGLTLAHNATQINFNAYTSGYCSTGTLHGVNITPSGSVIYCAYGTQLASLGTFLYYLTPGLIDTILGETGEIWAAPFLTALWFTAVNAQTLCGTGPPATPVLTINDFVGNTPLSEFPDFLSKVQTWFNARLWNHFCQCTPAPAGAPAPIPFPPPGQTAPTGIAPVVVFNCDGADICTILNELGQAIVGIQTNLVSIRSQVDLIQRQHVPFAYVLGTSHLGLSGAGTFTVFGILGLTIEITTQPSYFTSDMAPVASTWRFGTITWGTINGWLPRRNITHNPHLFLDIDADVTEIAYLFETGVVANIRELVREP